MAHYRRDQASNRDALFGSSSGGGGRKPRPSPRSSTAQTSAAPTRPAVTSPTASAASPSPRNSSTTSRSTFGSSPTADPHITPGPSTIFGGKIPSRNRMTVSILNGQAKIDKMAEAEDYRLKAKQAMTRGIFSKPDPISAANFYKRAADAYKACGENRLER